MDPLLNGMNDRRTRRLNDRRSPLDHGRAGSGKTRVLLHVTPNRPEKWSILGIFWPLPLIRPLGRWRSGLISSSQPPLAIATFTPCVCASFAEMRIALATIPSTLPCRSRWADLDEAHLKSLNLDRRNGIKRTILRGPFPIRMTWLMKWLLCRLSRGHTPRSSPCCYEAPEVRQSETDFDDLIMLTLRLFDSILMCWPITSRSSSSMWMSTKIPTMLNTNWSNSLASRFKISVSL